MESATPVGEMACPARPAARLARRHYRTLRKGCDAMPARPLRPFLSQVQDRVEQILNRLGNPAGDELCAIAASAERSEEERAEAISVLGYFKLLGVRQVTEAAAVRALLPAFWTDSKRLARSAAT